MINRKFYKKTKGINKIRIKSVVWKIMLKSILLTSNNWYRSLRKKYYCNKIYCSYLLFDLFHIIHLIINPEKLIR